MIFPALFCGVISFMFDGQVTPISLRTAFLISGVGLVALVLVTRSLNRRLAKREPVVNDSTLRDPETGRVIWRPAPTHKNR